MTGINRFILKCYIIKHNTSRQLTISYYYPKNDKQFLLLSVNMMISRSTTLLR